MEATNHEIQDSTSVDIGYVILEWDYYGLFLSFCICRYNLEYNLDTTPSEVSEFMSECHVFLTCMCTL